MKLDGVFCPVTTPFWDDRISPEKLSANLEKFNSAGLDGYVLFGSTGEAPYVAVEERIELLKAARKLIPVGEKTLVVGTGYETPDDTITFTKQAAEHGADCALVLTPSYYKGQMNDVVLTKHFSMVADAAPIPVLIYNVPPFTGVDISVKAAAKLAEHQNIVGIKDSTPNLQKLLSLIRTCAARMSVFVGNALYFDTAIGAGAAGAVLAVANILPDDCVEVFAGHRAKSYANSYARFKRITAAAIEIISPYGVPAIKAALDLLGFYGGPPRKPLLPVSGEAKEQIADKLRSLEVI